MFRKNNWLNTPNPEIMEQALQLPLPPYVGSVHWRVKRLADTIVSMSLLIMLSPVMLLTAVLIRISSQGPVFFRQERITQQGKRYQCLKFRTMKAGTNTTPHLKLLDRLIAGYKVPPREQKEGTAYKLTQDSRVTRVGVWLRKLSIDELPQLWNVLKGEMSLVGPQAPQAFEVERYRPEWLRRLSVPAGLTGPWQVYGRGRVPYATMIDMDLDYIDHWRLKRDFKLILKTVQAVLFAHGAH